MVLVTAMVSDMTTALATAMDCPAMASATVMDSAISATEASTRNNPNIWKRRIKIFGACTQRHLRWELEKKI
ncbi:unnamed protein product [Ixodes pacificus]